MRQPNLTVEDVVKILLSLGYSYEGYLSCKEEAYFWRGKNDTFSIMQQWCPEGRFYTVHSPTTTFHVYPNRD